MLSTAAAFSDYVLAVHIIAVMIAFGVTFSYPLFAFVGGRLDPSAMPWFHRMQATIGRRLTSPALGLVLIAGIILASDEHQWKHFYVQWGIAAVIVIGALEGAIMTRGEERLAEIAQRDLNASEGRETTWSGEYNALFKRLGMFGALLDLIVLVTIFFMALHL